jgi:hypothetical protein
MASLIEFSDDCVVYPVWLPADTASDGSLASSDYTATNLPTIDGFDKSMWILTLGTVASDETLDCQIYWASNAVATDAAEITNATDAVFVQCTSAHGGSVFILELDHVANGMETGVLFPNVAIHGTITWSIICILYKGNGARPTTQFQTVVSV